MEIDSIVKRFASDTLSGQLIATQSMLFFTPDSSMEDHQYALCVRKPLYIVQHKVKIDGWWATINLPTIQALGGVPYRYKTEANRNNVRSELYTTVPIDGISNLDSLYVIPCRIILYHHVDMDVPTLPDDDWCVSYNDTIYYFDYVQHSRNLVEILSYKP